MRTRRGLCYPRTRLCEEEEEEEEEKKRRKRSRREEPVDADSDRKKSKSAPEDAVARLDFFDGLPDEIVMCILCKLGSSASSPSDFINALLTCRRLNGLGLRPHVLSRASPWCIAAKARNWSDSAHRFLKQCADAGNTEALYTLGMIRFYCLQSRTSGASLMARAAIASHAPAVYSLAVIQFNGSGAAKNDKDLRAGFALCARAAFLGHVDAVRELGHCLQDGYGVRQNITEGRRYLVHANAMELASVLAGSRPRMTYHPRRHFISSGSHPLSDFRAKVPASEPHPANRFLSEWFGTRGGAAGLGLRLCSHGGCGRPETRRHEFRRCSVCGTVNYCSRACQALDWKVRHKRECTAIEPCVEEEEDNGDGDDEMEFDEEVEVTGEET